MISLILNRRETVIPYYQMPYSKSCRRYRTKWMESVTYSRFISYSIHQQRTYHIHFHKPGEPAFFSQMRVVYQRWALVPLPSWQRWTDERGRSFTEQLRLD